MRLRDLVEQTTPEERVRKIKDSLAMGPLYEETPWTDETANKDEQKALITAYHNGATIEAKGRDTLMVGYKWFVCAKPKWDFKNNYYRVKKDENDKSSSNT